MDPEDGFLKSKLVGSIAGRVPVVRHESITQKVGGNGNASSGVGIEYVFGFEF